LHSLEHQAAQLSLDGGRSISFGIAERHRDFVIPFRQCDREIEGPIAAAKVTADRVVGFAVLADNGGPRLKTKPRRL
jgi:hypothetical protein